MVLLSKISTRKNPQGKDLANWKFQRYMRDYMKTVKSLDDNVGRVTGLSERKEYAGQYLGGLYFRPRLLYGRTWLV